jgi:hypothetical protein
VSFIGAKRKVLEAANQANKAKVEKALVPEKDVKLTLPR